MIDILRNRRSVRQFTDQAIEFNKLEILKEAILLAPTSRNIEPCEFIVVQDKAMLKKLSTLKPHGASFLADCDTAFVICGDTSKSDVCVEDCSIAAIILQLTAESLGLGSCWVQARLRDHSDSVKSEKYIKELFDLPEHMLAPCVIGLGYPAAKKEPKTKEDLKFQKIHKETF
ncbi:MAG: NAD(P)H-dependent dehydrogenase/reductase [Denitrovibrio sp.]|nr:MAG: NAD(P)H-dependent dehydrogenase/reductase [Denitrovibrio sp.]